MRNKVAIGIFILFFFFWVLRNYFIDVNEDFYWPFAFYYLMALYGGLVGLSIAKEWGGWKSTVGKAINILSLGLLAQLFGQIYYSIMFEFLENTEPYPIGEIGFLSSVLIYVVGAYFLAKMAGSKLALKDTQGKILVFVVPVTLYVIAYFAFIKGLELNLSEITFDSVTEALSFVYPIVHATFVSLTLLAFLLSRKVLGGKLRLTVLGLLAALFMHYVAETYYLYQSYYDKFVMGGLTDLLFLIAYFVMTMALIQFKTALDKIKNNTIQ
jgi:hypothetical protein